MLKHLRFDIFEPQEMKLPVRLINTTNKWRLVQGHKNLLSLKEEIEDASIKKGESPEGTSKHLVPELLPVQQWQHRMKKCVNAEGNYFEGDNVTKN
ncbi:hypothetical protein TNCV_4819991 [Trichonephila clavipes]|nr:hypothetical protein TNCV_4819991 [Trichonephila clavipes]